MGAATYLFLDSTRSTTSLSSVTASAPTAVGMSNAVTASPLRPFLSWLHSQTCVPQCDAGNADMDATYHASPARRKWARDFVRWANAEATDAAGGSHSSPAVRDMARSSGRARPSRSSCVMPDMR